MTTLQQACIKSICENIETIQKFILLAPLPWTLIEDIILAYSSFKYNELINNYSDFKCYDEVLEDFEFVSSSEMSPELRSVLINFDFLEPYCHYDCYCAWFEYFKIHKYNLLLCNSCFHMLKDCFEYREQPFKYKSKRHHKTYNSNELHELYQKQKSWCSFCWLPLFELKSLDECCETLHYTKKFKFNC